MVSSFLRCPLEHKSPLRPVAIYVISFAILTATFIWLFSLPVTTLGCLGSLAGFGLVTLVMFFRVLKRHQVIQMGSLGYSGAEMEFLFGMIVTGAIALAMPISVLVFRFGVPSVFTAIGIGLIGAAQATLVAIGCGGDDWSKAAKGFREELKSKQV